MYQVSVPPDVFEKSGEPFVAVDDHGLITSLNSRALELFGVTRETAIGQDVVGEFLSPEYRADFYQAFNRFLATGEDPLIGERCEVEVLSKSGSTHSMEMTIVPLTQPSKATFHIFFHDMSSSRRAQAAEERLEALTEASADAIVTCDAEGKIQSWNQAAANSYGYTSEEICGEALSKLFPPERQQECEEILSRALSGSAVEKFETERKTKGGGTMPVLVAASPLFSSKGVRGVTLVEHDISEIKRYEEQLQFMAEHDPLTGLHNRRRFTVELEKRLASNEGGAILLVDLDNFKLVNDAHGHETGDNLLRLTATLLEENCAESDELAHFSSDEFALLLSGGKDEALDLAGQILAAIESTLAQELDVKLTHSLSASIGVVGFDTSETQSADELMISADLALYAAKERGGRRCVVYDPSLVSGIRQAERLQRALEEERLVLYAQPILDIATGEVSQYELLLRMRDGEEVLSPAGFLSAAERLGLIGAIDRWVLSQGVALAGEGHRVEVNLSGHSMTDQELPDLLEEAIQQKGARPEDVIFEITETTAIASMVEATRFAEKLQKLGCQFALDDFGTGFGSFSYLKHLPVSILKIDGEFIRSLTESKIDRRIVKAIVSVADALGCHTVAEWVTDKDTLDLVKSLGVTYAQGYYVGQPAPVAEMQLPKP